MQATKQHAKTAKLNTCALFSKLNKTLCFPIIFYSLIQISFVLQLQFFRNNTLQYFMTFLSCVLGYTTYLALFIECKTIFLYRLIFFYVSILLWSSSKNSTLPFGLESSSAFNIPKLYWVWVICPFFSKWSA